MKWGKTSSKNMLKYEINFENITDIEFELFNIFLIENKIGSLEESNSKFFFYLPSKESKNKLKKIENYLKSANIKYSIKLVQKLDDSYLYKWQEYLSPIIIENFLIKPSWFKLNIVEIDSAQAFGTGKHPTTQICLEFILKLIKNEQITSFLDCGTGSGILSIIVEKTAKVEEIIAFDIDFNAIITAKKNFLKNRCKKINLITGSFESLRVKEYDIVCANMLSSIILNYKDDLKKLTKKDKFLIISGIESDEEEKFLKNFCNSELKLLEKLKKDNWTGYLFKKL